MITKKQQEFHLEWLAGRKSGERIVMRDADLRDADLGGADLGGADLRGADLRGAALGGAALGWADLRGADLRRADLRGAALRGAALRWADLRWADLRWADLRWADLSGANLRGADLSEARLSHTKGVFYACIDKRGFTLVIWRHPTEVGRRLWFNAGCHSFPTQEAIKHWGGSEYRDTEQGKRYVVAIEFLVTTVGDLL